MNNILTPEAKQRRQIDRRKAAAYRRIVKLTPQALTVLELSLTDSFRENYPALAITAAKDILDRAGLNAADKIELDVTVSTLADAIRSKREARQVVLTDGATDNG